MTNIDMKKMDTAGNFVEEISYEMFVEEIVSLQEELAEVLESEETEDTLTHVVYVGKADKIVGREFIAKEDGKEVFKISFKPLSFASARSLSALADS